MLDLTFSPEQEMLRETVRGVVATTSPLSVVRENSRTTPPATRPSCGKQLAHLDLIGLQLPEEYGGSGMTTLETVVLYEEFGRSLAPSPHFVSSILSGGSLARSGSADQKQAGFRASCRVRPSSPRRGWSPRTAGPTGVQCGPCPTATAGRITGTKRHVGVRLVGRRLVVLARTGDAPADVDLFLVDPPAPGSP